MILSPTPLRPGNQGALQAVATAPHDAVPEAACIRYRRLTQELPPACMPPSPLRPTVAGCLREPCPAAVLSVSPPRPTRFRVRIPKNVKTPAAVQSKTVFSEEQTKSAPTGVFPAGARHHHRAASPGSGGVVPPQVHTPRRRRLHGRRSTMQLKHNVSPPSVAEQIRSHACPCRICDSPHRPPPQPADTTPPLTSNSPRPKSPSARRAGGDQARRGGRRLHSGRPRPCQPARCPVGHCSTCARTRTEPTRPVNRGPPQV